MNRIDELLRKYLIFEAIDPDMMSMAKEISKKTAINPEAIYKYFQLKKIDFSKANDIMAKYSKSKKWSDLAVGIIVRKAVI
jgi:hypothetical protein